MSVSDEFKKDAAADRFGAPHATTSKAVAERIDVDQVSLRGLRERKKFSTVIWLGARVSVRQGVHLSIRKVLLGLVVATIATLPVEAARLALVLGNDNYSNVPKLQKAGNDATAMARELKAAGFSVQLHRDLNYRAMVRAVETFTGSIKGGDVVVVFFAGHGVQIKNGAYLLPTDIEATSESEVEKTAYELNGLTEKISDAKASFSLVMIDACRDNPLPKNKGRSVGSTRGLSAIEPPKGQMVVYSASKGQQALDRLSDQDSNPNSVFTREFIVRMRQPGARIEDLVREVQDSVEVLAGTVKHEQRPALYNESRGSFFFFGPTAVQVAPVLANAAELTAANGEESFWGDAKLAGNREAFNAYLESYPVGRYASLAKANLARLSVSAAPPVTLHVDSQSVASVLIKPNANIEELKFSQQASKSKLDGHPARGLTVGDRWNYQVIDMYTGAVVRRFAQQLAHVETTGAIVLSDDADYRDPWYRFTRVMLDFTQPGQPPSASGKSVWWEGIKVGERRKLAFKSEKDNGKGKLVPASLEVTIVSKGVERIRVPAGEFQAIRLECSGTTAWEGTTYVGFGVQPLYLSWTATLWYVPTLHAHVAIEFVTGVNQMLGRGPMERTELVGSALQNISLAGP